MKKISYILYIVGTLLLFASCGEKKNNHVVLIGADGFSAETIAKNPGAFPNIEAMMKDGSYTLHRRTVLPSSSACNWASMLMGASPEIHGYTTYNSAKPDLPSREIGKYGRFPGIFGLIREQKPEAKTGFFYEWSVMSSLFDEGSENMKKQGKGQPLTDAAIEFFNTNNPTFTFIAHDEPDHTGHAAGWLSPGYMDKCKEMDTYVGQIRAAVAKSPIANSTYVIFTSDHGGTGTNHGGKTMSEMESPLIITGPGIKKNYDIPESTMIYDIASTVADLLGLQQPQVWIGRPIKSIQE